MKINWRTVYSHIPKSALSVLQGPILYYCPVPENRLPFFTEVYSTCHFSTAPRNCQSVTCILEMNTAVAEQPPGQGYTLQLLNQELNTTHSALSLPMSFAGLWLGGHLPGRTGMWCFLGLRLFRLKTIECRASVHSGLQVPVVPSPQAL